MSSKRYDLRTTKSDDSKIIKQDVVIFLLCDGFVTGIGPMVKTYKICQGNVKLLFQKKKSFSGHGKNTGGRICYRFLHLTFRGNIIVTRRLYDIDDKITSVLERSRKLVRLLNSKETYTISSFLP